MIMISHVHCLSDKRNTDNKTATSHIMKEKSKLQVLLKTTDQLDKESEQLVTGLQQTVWHLLIIKRKTPGLDYLIEVRE